MKYILFYNVESFWNLDGKKNMQESKEKLEKFLEAPVEAIPVVGSETRLEMVGE